MFQAVKFTIGWYQLRHGNNMRNLFILAVLLAALSAHALSPGYGNFDGTQMATNVPATISIKTNASLTNITAVNGITVTTNSTNSSALITISPDFAGIFTHGVAFGNSGLITTYDNHGPGLNQPELGIQGFSRVALVWGNTATQFQGAFQLGTPPGTNITSNPHGPMYLSGQLQDSTNVGGVAGNGIPFLFNVRNIAGTDDQVGIQAWHMDTNDTTTLNLYNPVSNPYAVGTNQMGTKQLEVWPDGIVSHGKLFSDYIQSSPGTNFAIYFTDPVGSEINLSTATTFTIMTNSTAFLKNQSVTRILRIRPGVSSWGVAFPSPSFTNIIWESETGIQIAPTNVPASNILTIAMTAAVAGGQTNYYANYRMGPYTPSYDPTAAMLFAAITNAGGTLTATEKSAANTLITTGKSQGWWYSNDVAYLFLGGTTNSMSFNAVNTNTYRWFASGTVTTNATGVTGDGSTGFLNTFFTPSTSGSTNYLLNSASISFYSKTAAPTGNGVFLGCDSGGSAYARINQISASAVQGRINDNSDDGVAGMATLAGFYTETRTAANTTALYAPGGGFNGGVSSASGLPAVPMYVFCRNNGGTAASFCNATINYISIGGAKSSTQQGQESAAVTAFQTALGRQ